MAAAHATQKLLIPLFSLQIVMHLYYIRSCNVCFSRHSLTEVVCIALWQGAAHASRSADAMSEGALGAFSDNEDGAAVRSG